MANFALSRLERIFLQTQSTFGVIPNSGGTATVAGTDYCRHIQAALDNTVGLLVRPDKTGSRTRTQGQLGRKFATWTLSQSLAPSGTAGTAPDCDPILQALFGGAPATPSGTVSIVSSTNASPIVVTATAHGLATGDAVKISSHATNTEANGFWIVTVLTVDTFSLTGSTGNGVGGATGTVTKTSVRYNVADAIPYFTMWSFRQPSSLRQRAIHSAVVSQATFNLGQDVADWQANGEGVWVLDSTDFSASDAYQQASLSAFPTEPGSPTSAGGIIPGFTGRAVFNLTTIAAIRKATVTIKTGNVMIKDTFGSYYPDSSEGDMRDVSVNFQTYENDAAADEALETVAYTKAPIDVILQLGTVAGSVAILHLKGVQLASPTRTEERRYSRNYADSMATGSSVTALDEIALHLL